MNNNNDKLNSVTVTVKPLLFTLIALIFLAFVIRSSMNPITSLPASADSSVFSGERAKNMLNQLLKEEQPHPVDSVENKRVEQRLVSLLTDMGYSPEIQDTSLCRDFDVGIARCTRVRNIIVTIKGTDKNTGILLSAHYDSVDAGPGASDAGAAVATLLETARLLSTQNKVNATPFKNTLVLLFNEGEEFGLFGATAFMEQHPLAKNIKLAINIEARGSGGQSVMFETGENSGWLVDIYSQVTSKPFSSSLFYEVYKFLPNDTDLTIYKEHGLQGLNFAHAEKLSHYHTPLDNLARLNTGTIQHHGDNAWGVIQAIKDKDLTTVAKGNLVYTDILGQFVIKWPEEYSKVFFLALLVLYIWVLVRLNKHNFLDRKSIFKGAIAFITITVVTIAVAIGLQYIVQLISGKLTPWYSNNLPMQIVLWSGLSLVGILLAKWFAKNTSAIGLLVSLLSFWLLFAGATSFAMPGLSYLFLVPCVISLLALFVLPNIYQNNARLGGVSVLVISVMGVALMFMPIVYVLETMVGYGMTAALGIMFSFIVSALLPLLAFKTTSIENKTAKNITFLKVFSGLSICFIIGIIWLVSQSEFSPEQPQGFNFYHVQNGDGKDNSPSTLLAGWEKRMPSTSLTKVLGTTKTQQGVPWSRIKNVSINVESQQLAAAALKITSRVITTEGKSVTVEINAKDEKLREVRLYIPKDSALISIYSLGSSLNYSEEKAIRNGYYELQCRGLSCQSFTAVLNFAKTDETEILLVKVLQNLPSSDQLFLDNRGAASVPIHDGDRSLIISKIKL